MSSYPRRIERFCFLPSVGSSGQWLPQRSVGGSQLDRRVETESERPTTYLEAWGQPAVIKHFIWWGRCSDNIEVLRERNMTFRHCLSASLV